MDGEKWIQYGPSPRILCGEFGQTPMSRILWDYGKGCTRVQNKQSVSKSGFKLGGPYIREETSWIPKPLHLHPVIPLFPKSLIPS